MSKPCRILAASFALAAVAVVLAPEALAVKKVTFNHADCKETGDEECLKRESISLKNGERFEVWITGTYPDSFLYSLRGFSLPSPQDSTGVNTQARTPPRDTTVVLEYTHSDSYAGYIITIRPKKPDVKILGEATLVVEVEQRGWRVGFSGGFTASSLTSPVYGIFTDSNGTGIVREEREKKADASLGLASFVTVSHEGIPEIGISFGLGLETGGGPRYFLGPSWLWGDKGALTAGIALGDVDALPPGVRVNKPVNDPNDISNPASRTEVGWFVSVSYLFIGGAKEKLKKPFASPQETRPDGHLAN